jgi:hypothetical protein
LSPPAELAGEVQGWVGGRVGRRRRQGPALRFGPLRDGPWWAGLGLRLSGCGRRGGWWRPRGRRAAGGAEPPPLGFAGLAEGGWGLIHGPATTAVGLEVWLTL